MAFPQPSTALDEAPSSFWFVRNVGGVQNVCSTNGYSFLSNVQAAIQQQLAASGPLPSIGGTIRARDIANISTPVYSEGVEGIGSGVVAYDTPTPQSVIGWDVTTLRGLYALAQKYHASRATLAQIEADSTLPAGHPLSPLTVQYAMWLTFISPATDVSTGLPVYGHGSPSEVALATHPPTIYPVMITMPPFPRDGVVDTVLACAPNAAVIPTESPITVTSSFTPNVWLLLAVLTAAVVGASLVTKKAPRLVQLRRNSART